MEKATAEAGKLWKRRCEDGGRVMKSKQTTWATEGGCAGAVGSRQGEDIQRDGEYFHGGRDRILPTYVMLFEPVLQALSRSARTPRPTRGPSTCARTKAPIKGDGRCNSVRELACAR